VNKFLSQTQLDELYGMDFPVKVDALRTTAICGCAACVLWRERMKEDLYSISVEPWREKHVGAGWANNPL